MTTRQYTRPIIQEVRLDNEISLQLASSPPVGLGETSIGPETPGQVEGMTNDPYQYDNW